MNVEIKEQMYEGNAKQVFATSDPEIVILAAPIAQYRTMNAIFSTGLWILHWMAWAWAAATS